MDSSSQLHADFILKLKNTHPCEQHRGEHGEVGYCYVWPNGGHLGLNNRRLAIWAAAMVRTTHSQMNRTLKFNQAAGEATRHVPPNVAEFDGPQGSGSTLPKARGRAATSATAPAAPLVPPSTSSDAASLLMAAMVPLVMSLTQSVVPRGSLLASPVVPTTEANMPTSSTSLAKPDLNVPIVAPTLIFLPSHTLDCLIAFKDEAGINIIDKAQALDHRDLTPDIIPEVCYSVIFAL
jgi:hypothetical protein